MHLKKDKVKILLYGYNGVNNIGSEAKLLTTIKDLKEELPDRIEKIGCLTQNVDNQKRYIKDKDIEIIGIGPVTAFLNPTIIKGKYDVLILNEGSTFIDHFSSGFIIMFCLSALLAKARGMKVVCYANDCGHLKRMNQRLLRFTLNKVDLIMLRNPDAVERMKKYGVRKEIHITADGAYEYELPPKEYQQELFQKLELDPQQNPIIGICPKEFFHWPIIPRLYGPKEALYRYPFYHSWTKTGKESSRKYVQQTAAYIDWCIEKFHYNVLIIAMENMDYLPSKKIYDNLKHKDKVRLISPDGYIVDDIITLLSNSKFLVTTRYHAAVLSSNAAIPMIAVSSDTRCEAVFKELDMMELYIDYVEHPQPTAKVENLYELLIDKTEKLIETEDELKNKIAQFHSIFLERCLRNRKIFKEWFNNTFTN